MKVLYLGGVTRGRGIEESIQALQYLPDANLIVMGPARPVFLEKFRQAAADLGVALHRAGAHDVAPSSPRS